MKRGFITSGYPEATNDSLILPILHKAESGLNNNNDMNSKKKEDHEFLLQIPFINDTFTRVTKSNNKRLGLKVKVVIQSGKKVKSIFPKNKPTTCDCYYCKILNIPCKSRNFVYHAKCIQCNGEYIGGSARPGQERMAEYESEIRLPQQTQRTTLSRHRAEFHPNAPNKLEECYKFKILDKGKDPLQVFLKEGLHIQKHNPLINGKFNNGFVI